VGTTVAELGELVWGAGVVVVVDVDVFVAVLVVEVFVGALVVEVFVGVDLEVRVGASLVGGLVVRVGIGVRDGSVGRLSERDALGRFEPPHTTPRRPGRPRGARSTARGSYSPASSISLSCCVASSSALASISKRCSGSPNPRYSTPTLGSHARPPGPLNHRRMEAGAAATSVARPDLHDRSVVRWVRYEMPCFASRDRSRAGRVRRWTSGSTQARLARTGGTVSPGEECKTQPDERSAVALVFLGAHIPSLPPLSCMTLRWMPIVSAMVSRLAP
jgi:hypothetical protein